ncbi:MAG: CBS domain-containing protein [Pseudomonadota bacterium]|nr:CBS domain-containing protein [Pseudomonadota bacterium]
MRTIKELLDEKGHEVSSIGPDDLVYDALELMAEQKIGALIVLENGKPVGLVSERDYARNVALEGRSSRNTPVKDIMTARVVCAAPDQSVEECMAVMTEKRVRHLPVIESGQLVGLVSIGDLVKSIISEQQFIIEQLEHYISG